MGAENVIVEKYLKDKLVKHFEEIEEAKQKNLPLELWVGIVDDANRTINLFCGRNTALYDKYRYRMFVLDGKVSVAQGEEIDVDIRRKVNQTPNDYR